MPESLDSKSPLLDNFKTKNTRSIHVEEDTDSSWCNHSLEDVRDDSRLELGMTLGNADPHHLNLERECNKTVMEFNPELDSAMSEIDQIVDEVTQGEVRVKNRNTEVESELMDDSTIFRPISQIWRSCEVESLSNEDNSSFQHGVVDWNAESPDGQSLQEDREKELCTKMHKLKLKQRGRPRKMHPFNFFDYTLKKSRSVRKENVKRAGSKKGGGQRKKEPQTQAT